MITHRPGLAPWTGAAGVRLGCARSMSSCLGAVMIRSSGRDHRGGPPPAAPPPTCKRPLMPLVDRPQERFPATPEVLAAAVRPRGADSAAATRGDGAALAVAAVRQRSRRLPVGSTTPVRCRYPQRVTTRLGRQDTTMTTNVNADAVLADALRPAPLPCCCSTCPGRRSSKPSGRALLGPASTHEPLTVLAGARRRHELLAVMAQVQRLGRSQTVHSTLSAPAVPPTRGRCRRSPPRPRLLDRRGHHRHHECARTTCRPGRRRTS